MELVNLRKDLILALIQGVTEIFPVSSSGHLVIFSHVLDRPINLNLLLFFHLGTFLAILIRFRREVTDIVSGRHGWKLPGYLFISLLVTGVIALLLRSITVRIMTGNLSVVTYMWIINGVVLVFIGLFAPQGMRRLDQLHLQDFILIGFFQGMTVVPGISRLGITLGTALMIGAIWKDALRLSFLLSLPTIILANVYETLLRIGWFSQIGIFSTGEDIFGLLEWTVSQDIIISGGIILIISLAGGLMALYILSEYLTRKLLYYFGFYCLAAGMFFLPYLKLFE